ncbi:hypothetical protein RB602_05565 [Parasphingorhabdus sp. SCSIO 66989]|uniref:Uncharacterized protein n=1 Tax=Alterisphingorhabdus coralli TaxID=3071408 RepID=A0AA97FBU2_9SPHN|nr:hypothetical protein [Parasphingorhabdus sp. SCSIO 66989]WOE76180.1 hypothetical protein RB602_05565 [Parasphingorhabdus sp. SCSIO 66989]
MSVFLQAIVSGKLGAIIHGEGMAQLWRELVEPVIQMIADLIGMFAGELGHQDEARGAFMQDEYGLAWF